MDPDYCGDCYGAPSPTTAKKPGCCNTCDEVRDAYAGISWSFTRGDGVEQCEREHYGEKLDAQKREGCRIEGGIRVNKVIGNFHFAPGKSFSNGNMHVHDLENYFKDESSHTFSHTINSLRFGPQLPDDVIAKLEASGMSSSSLWTNHHINPLDGQEQRTDEKAFNYMYFVKVVSTAYLPLGWENKGTSSLSGILPDADRIPLGSYGMGVGGENSIETHQYSVTSHKRSLAGGNDEKEGHKERLHARGGIPGVFFSYVSFSYLPLSFLLRKGKKKRKHSNGTASKQDISPMKVVNRESRAKSFSAFLVGVCAVIGGTLTVAAAVDRALYEGSAKLKKIHQG